MLGSESGAASTNNIRNWCQVHKSAIKGRKGRCVADSCAVGDLLVSGDRALGDVGRSSPGSHKSCTDA